MLYLKIVKKSTANMHGFPYGIKNSHTASITVTRPEHLSQFVYRLSSLQGFTTGLYQWHFIKHVVRRRSWSITNWHFVGKIRSSTSNYLKIAADEIITCLSSPPVYGKSRDLCLHRRNNFFFNLNNSKKKNKNKNKFL